MGHEAQFIANLTVAFIIALAGGLLAHKLRQSPMLGYLAAGIAIGPFARPLVGEPARISELAEIGVLFLMFALGIEFSLKELARVKGPAILGTTFQVLTLMACGWAFGHFLGWPLGQSLFFGGVICISSTMVILKTLMSRGEIESAHGRLMLAMLIVQDLAVVLLILILPRIAAGGPLQFGSMAFLALKAALFIGATLYLGERVVPKLMARIEEMRSQELFILTAVALALGTATISAKLGLSPALGAFMGGLMLTETEFDHRVVAEVVPLRDLFATLFFVSVGMLVDLNFVWQNWPAVLGMALFLMAAKSLVTLLVLLPFRVGGKTATFAALGMIPIGEFNYVLAHVGLANKILSEPVYNLILASSLITIVFTPGAFWIAPRASRVLASLPGMKKVFLSRAERLNASGKLLHDHAIVVGYGRVGKRLARGLRRAGMTVVIIENDLHLVQEVRDAGYAAIYGDATYRSVLAAARPAKAKLVVVALPDFGATRAVVHRVRQINEDAIIVARAQRSENDVKLREAGATTVVVPEIAGALMLLEETLLLMGLPHDHIFTGLGVLQQQIQLAHEAADHERTDAARHLQQ
jgi:monovalent cation:H+ antiporter-2, CPA2 family